MSEGGGGGGRELLRHPDSGPQSKYVGYKWGIFLRAPDIFFALLRRSEGRFKPLGGIAEVRFGVKTGCDDFFFIRDVTDSAVQEDISERRFRDRYGLRRAETGRVRIVEAGDGSMHLVEGAYLEPEVHSLMEIDSVRIDTRRLERKIVLVSDDKNDLDGQHVLDYINWGEREGFHRRSTVQARVTAGRNWYDLTQERRPELILPKIQQYRHIVCLNSRHLLCNSSLLAVFTSDVEAPLLCAILNSTVVALMKHFFARVHGREGSLQLDVYSANMMPIPDPSEATDLLRRRLRASLTSMRRRRALPLVDVDAEGNEWTGDLAFQDRQDLDDAVLELLGISSSPERACVRSELYAEMSRLYRQIRAGERIMQRYRAMTARRGRPTPGSLADEIWEELANKPERKTPLDFVPADSVCDDLNVPLGQARVFRRDLFHGDAVQIGDTVIELADPSACEFTKVLVDLGMSGKVRVPRDPAVCREALAEYSRYLREVSDQFAEAAAAYTAEQAMQERVVRELWRRLAG